MHTHVTARIVFVLSVLLLLALEVVSAPVVNHASVRSAQAPSELASTRQTHDPQRGVTANTAQPRATLAHHTKSND